MGSLKADWVGTSVSIVTGVIVASLTKVGCSVDGFGVGATVGLIDSDGSAVGSGVGAKVVGYK